MNKWNSVGIWNSKEVITERVGGRFLGWCFIFWSVGGVWVLDGMETTFI